MKKAFESVIDTVEGVSEGVTKTMTVTSKESSKAFADLILKTLELMNEQSIKGPYSSITFSRSLQT